MTQAWQPIETAPRDGTEFLGCGPHTTRVVAYWWEEDGEPVWFDGDCRLNATHWMPLPPRPEGTP